MILVVVRKSILFVGLALLLAGVSASAQAAILAATEDNYVFRGPAGLTTTQGTGNETTFTLKEAQTNQGNARFAYLKFNLATIDLSSNNAGSFSFTSTGPATTDYILRVYALNSLLTGYEWAENAITYNNRPAYNDTTFPLLDLNKVTQVGADINVINGTLSGTTHTFSFANLDNYRQPDNTLTLIAMITDQINGSPSFSFASSEHGTAALQPTLVVTAIPEPTAIGLLGLSITGAILWRRRR